MFSLYGYSLLLMRVKSFTVAPPILGTIHYSESYCCILGSKHGTSNSPRTTLESTCATVRYAPQLDDIRSLGAWPREAGRFRFLFLGAGVFLMESRRRQSYERMDTNVASSALWTEIDTSYVVPTHPAAWTSLFVSSS